jgi:dTDP-4-amino-4,6-dideoxygalactose transaminase
MEVGFYGHVRQYRSIQAEIDQAIREVLESGQYVLGPTLKRFEKELADYHGMEHAVGVNSGTDALWLAFMALGIGKGDEVITVPNTFFATAEAIWIAGAKAVFVDCDPRTKNIDPSRIEAAITPKTKAVCPVHLYGQPADMPAIAEIAKKHGLLVVEDNAQAIGSKGDTFKIGELSDAVCTSFIIQKNLGCFGDGGAVLTNNAQVAERIKQLRNHGSPARSVHSMGYNSRLDEIHAAVLSVKLKHLDAWNDRRRSLAAMYTESLEGTGLGLPYEKPGYRHVFHLYVIETAPEKRDAMLKFLNDSGVDAKCHYPIAIHQQAGYPWGQEAAIVGPLTNAEANAACCISLPIYPELTEEELQYTVDKVMEFEKANA